MSQQQMDVTLIGSVFIEDTQDKPLQYYYLTTNYQQTYQSMGHH